MKGEELRRQTQEFLNGFGSALQSGSSDIGSAPWAAVRELLSAFTRSRARQGFTPRETAVFLFALKAPLGTRVRDHFRDDSQSLADATWERELDPR